ncbi:MAG TPA: BlaI/MecI/CopY family transcriptional regulator [Candidatus Sulfotelmatobacter sp.]|nr:BlaI/MecI/CopY family transcriptional regulator [Candidatus Sulfotelmatobacter sp.]
MPSPRRAVLDLAPLELDCLNTLWPMGEGTVREIRDALAARRPRAYTTIMTIMDRLARKGVVERQKVGRAYRYRPNLSAEDARAHALSQVVENFFGGSVEALRAQLAGGLAPSSSPSVSTASSPRARAAAASAAAPAPSAPPAAAIASPVRSTPVSQASGEPASETERIDDTLL